MPIRSELEKELAERLVYGGEINNAAFLVGHDINRITHDDGTPLSFVEKIEMANAIRTRLIDGTAFKRIHEGGGELAKIARNAIARQQVLDVIEYVMQIVLRQLEQD